MDIGIMGCVQIGSRLQQPIKMVSDTNDPYLEKGKRLVEKASRWLC
jgi:uncharacterized protein with ATP-grasp and redox domains